MKTTISVSYRSVQLFRILLSGIFLVASFNHILNLEKTIYRIDQARFKGIAYFFGNPEYLIIISGVLMMIAGFLLLVGYKTKWAAMALAAVLVPITLTVQAGQIHTLGPLFKNMAILGGLLFFILNDIQTFQKQ
ncbi:putative oxidoreductase [Gillisia sp. Hel_I_86]|uniref:DoxX family protein n=1 Tax=Gillisia sp. Hel_I_86 TaxID=1249981 RepID=UPI00119C1668|nr:DoxX family membrane protein [Gillisia sp. Hel_I_86]TVZ27111.1 putative oxidoreductase [Gillisia sp. Hel_I_86]